MSASKVREVLDLIRGKDIIAARDVLIYSERMAARTILKVLASAVANAENNDGIPPDELFVSACFADEGATLKRFKPRARGRASQILKRTCHITIYVSRMESARISVIANKRSADSTKRAEQRSVRVRKSSGQAQENVASSSIDEIQGAQVIDVNAQEVETFPVDDVNLQGVRASDLSEEVSDSSESEK